MRVIVHAMAIGLERKEEKLIIISCVQLAPVQLAQIDQIICILRLVFLSAVGISLHTLLHAIIMSLKMLMAKGKKK